MCGIAGFYDTMEFISPDANLHDIYDNQNRLLITAKELLMHRGPDDAGIFHDSVAGVGLVHTRLSILDLSPLGHQPMMSVDKQVVLTFNGEIYNFIELRSELEMAGVQFRGHSDTEVLLQLYLHIDNDFAAMLRKLNGIFSFALWDVRKKKLFIVRDALGVKPLYVFEQEGRVAFASEIKALFPFIHSLYDDLDINSLFRYSTYLWCPGDGTPLKNVKKLGPGEFIEVQQGQIVRRMNWYRLPTFCGIRPTLSKADAVSGTLDHLRKAVHRQLVSDVPVGAFLSGGLDSSSIVALAKEQQPDINCFTVEITGGQEDGFSDDLPYARKVASHLDVPLQVVTIDSDQMASGLENMVSQLDEPLADPASLNVFFISQLARDQGIKVLLSGAGGDDVFTGYRRHYAQNAEKWFQWMPSVAKQSLQALTSRLDQSVPLYRRLTKFFDVAVLDNDERIAHYFSWIRRSDLLTLYSTEMRDKLQTVYADSPMLDFLADVPLESTSLQRMLSLDQRFFLTDHNLTYTDKMSMAVGVEVRVPFLDAELIEFAARIPDRYKQSGATGKWVLKKAMEPYLPRDVIYRPKSGFGAPLRRWIRFELRELLGDLLSEDSLRKRGIFNPSAVHRLIARNDSGEVDASYTLFSLLCIEIWCRQYIDRQFNYQTIYGHNL